MTAERGARPLGSRLLGRRVESGARLRARVQTLLTLSLLIANLVGAVIAIVLLAWVLPGPSIVAAYGWALMLGGPLAYVAVATLVGLVWITRRAFSALHWAREEREPQPHEQRATLRLPFRLTVMQVALWVAAVLLFGGAALVADPDVAPKIIVTTAITGFVVAANCYLLSELFLRPYAALALSGESPDGRRRSGVTVRIMLTWALGACAPVIGLMLGAVLVWTRGGVTPVQLSVTILVVGVVILAFGSLLMFLVASAVVAPVRAVRQAMARVARGDLDTEVVVFDGTELGQLQAGFNQMAAGLRERERIRDLFGRHVGQAVARSALSREVEMGGEERDVAVLFVDVVGSTTMAATLPPTDVVTLLNRFFTVVVDEVDRHDGLINKFEGDAALAIFGAPHELDDNAGAALAAARAMATRLRAEVPECQAGIGVAAGRAVAGNIGDEKRFEYTVIGDPVNEAARLTELAKSVPGMLVASMRAVSLAGEEEASRWRAGDEITLRGRTAPTLLATPV